MTTCAVTYEMINLPRSHYRIVDVEEPFTKRLAQKTKLHLIYLLFAHLVALVITLPMPRMPSALSLVLHPLLEVDTYAIQFSYYASGALVELFTYLIFGVR